MPVWDHKFQGTWEAEWDLSCQLIETSQSRQTSSEIAIICPELSRRMNKEHCSFIRQRSQEEEKVAEAAAPSPAPIPRHSISTHLGYLGDGVGFTALRIHTTFEDMVVCSFQQITHFLFF